MTNAVSARFDPARAQDFVLVVGVGDKFAEDGLTEVHVSGTGTVVVYQYNGERAGEPLRGELSRDEIGVLFGALSDLSWHGQFPNRPGIPDEAIVEWRLRDAKGEEVTRKTWLRDAEKDPAMSRALEILRRQVDRLSGGKLFL